MLNQEIGAVVIGRVSDENAKNYFVQYHQLTYALSKQEGEYQVGDFVEGFIYTNTSDKRRMTTNLPTVRQHQYDWAEVVSVQPKLGVFVSIGLSDKDIAVSFDHLPEDRYLWPKPGDKLFVKLSVDKKERLWAVPAEERIFEEITKSVPRQKGNFQNNEIEGRVYRVGMSGVHVITKLYHRAFIHESEYQQSPRLGESVKGRVIGIGQNKNFNLSLKPLAHERIGEDAQMILMNLKRRPNHQLPFNDKSNPDDIRAYFGISKGQFKRALGHLLKERLVMQTEEGIVLND
ncbi:CvfB family protein [Aerococcus vaginalis]